MKQVVFNYLAHIFAGLALLFIILAGVVLFHTYAPQLESYLHPVVKEFRVSDTLNISDNEILVRGNLNKVRDECQIDSLVANTVNRSKTLKIPAKVDIYSLDGSTAALKIQGIQGWGPWKVTTSNDSPPETELTIYGYFRCHDMYLIPTRLTSIPIIMTATKQIDH